MEGLSRGKGKKGVGGLKVETERREGKGEMLEFAESRGGRVGGGGAAAVRRKKNIHFLKPGIDSLNKRNVVSIFHESAVHHKRTHAS